MYLINQVFLIGGKFNWQKSLVPTNSCLFLGDVLAVFAHGGKRVLFSATAAAEE